MEASDHGSVPEPVTVRAGRVVAVEGGCFWCGLLDALEVNQQNVIADLRDTISLTPRAMELIVYVSAGLSAARRLGILADWPTRGMIEATLPPACLNVDLASDARELAELWGADQ